MKTYKKNRILFAIAAISTSLFASSGLARVEGPQTLRLEINITDEEAVALKSAKKVQIPNATLQVFNAGKLIQETQITLHSRGQTSLAKFSRKNIEMKALASDGEQKSKIHIGAISGKDLILTAGPEDILVTKNLISNQILQKVNVPALATDCAELMINNQSQGLYMVTKAPAEQALKTNDADVIFRRRYNDDIELKKAKSALSEDQVGDYRKTLESLHHSLLKLKGQELFEALSQNFNLGQYMRWLAVNYLTANGDYSDEVFFVGRKSSEGKNYFDIMPWDNDDIFAEQMHLSKFPTLPNYGQSNKADNQMLFSFESRLDLAISRDAVLLQKYFQVIAAVVQELGENDQISKVFSAVENKITPYLSDSDILRNGMFDSVKQAHDPTKVLAGLRQHNQELHTRIQKMNYELNLISQERPEERTKKLSHWKKFWTEFDLKMLRKSSKKEAKKD